MLTADDAVSCLWISAQDGHLMRDCGRSLYINGAPHPASIERRSGAHIETHGLTTSNIETHTRIHIYRHRASAASAHLVAKDISP